MKSRIQEKKEIKKKIEEPGFKMKKLKVKKDPSFWMRGKGISIEKEFLFFLEDRDLIRICLVKEKSSPLIIKVFNWNMKT